MNDNTAQTQTAQPAEKAAQPHPAPKARAKKNARFNHVWWIPLIALLIVTYIVVNRYLSQGSLVNITFTSAEGLAVEKTKVRYKDVSIGQVEKISLSEDYKNVTVSVRMSKNSEGMLRENTRFWVVKPRISITQISGLNTLLSGNYITIEPDKNPDSAYRYQFAGLENPPIITQDEPGLKLTLLASQANSLYPGTAVYYKGMQVGTVNRVYFSSDHLWVKADIFVTSPHDKLIQTNTKFWSASGFTVDVATDGVSVDMESVEALIAGGIAFATPVTLASDDEAVTEGTEFILYDDKNSAFEKNSGRKHLYVSYFDGNVKGLAVDAPVMVQGLAIGKVKDIQLLFDEQQDRTRIPVLFEVYESRIGMIDSAADNDSEGGRLSSISEHFLTGGVQARLTTDSLLTGSKYVDLFFTDSDSRTPLVVDGITGYSIVPTSPDSFNALTTGVSELLNKVNQLPLADVVENVNKLLKNADDKVSQLEFQSSIDELNRLLQEGRVLSKSARNTLKSLNQTVSALSQSVDKALSGFSPDAPLYYNLNTTLEELNSTVESIKAVTDMLDRKPDALIFGEDRKHDKN